MGQGFMHTGEGMVTFGGAFLLTGLVTWLLGYAERVPAYFRQRSVA